VRWIREARPVSGSAPKVHSSDAWRVGRRRAGPDWTRRFIHGASCGCKVRVQPGIHHRPSRKGQSGATRESLSGSLGGRESGQLENQPVGNAEGPGIQGNLEISPSAGQGSRRCGATRRFCPGKTGRGQTRGNSGGCQPVPEDPGCGATRKGGHRRYRKTGQRGNSRSGRSAPPKDASVGATRNSIAGKAGDARAGQLASASEALQGGVRKRGDPWNHKNRQRRKIRNSKHSGNGAIREPGQPGIQGNLDVGWPAQPNGPRRRGNPRNRRRRGRSARNRGNPEPQTRQAGGCSSRGNSVSHPQAERDDA
jgi:hypothetical protein